MQQCEKQRPRFQGIAALALARVVFLHSCSLDVFCVPFSLYTNAAGMLPALYINCISPASSSDGPKHLRNLQGLNYPMSFSSASNHFTLSLPSLWPQAHSHLLIGLAQLFWYLISTKSRNKVLCSDLTSSLSLFSQGGQASWVPTRAGSKLCSSTTECHWKNKNFSPTTLSCLGQEARGSLSKQG